jgi:hypothetical protein
MPISLRHPIVRLREFIYYPRCASFRQLSVEASACALRPWRDQQRRYIGWRSQRRRARAKNRLLVFHGNLLQRTFAFDVLARPECGGRLRLLATIEDRAVIEKILRHLQLPIDLPVAAPAWVAGWLP